MEQPEIKVNHIETKSVMTKSNTPIGGYSVNPYVGCPHACHEHSNQDLGTALISMHIRVFMFLAVLSGMWDLSSLTRDQT